MAVNLKNRMYAMCHADCGKSPAAFRLCTTLLKSSSNNTLTPSPVAADTSYRLKIIRDWFNIGSIISLTQELSGCYTDYMTKYFDILLKISENLLNALQKLLASFSSKNNKLCIC